jgi:hypothetical protein
MVSKSTTRHYLRVEGGSSSTYKDDLEQHLLVHLHELLVPLVNVGRLLARVRVIILRGGRVLAVMLAPFNNFLHDGLVDLGSVC